MINNRIKRFLSMLMCMVVAVTSPCTSVFAYTEYETEELIEDEEEYVCEEPSDDDGEDLFERYMLQEAGEIINDAGEEIYADEEAGSVYVERGSLLAGNEKQCYDTLKEQCSLVASGQRADTVIYIPFQKSLLQEYTAEMLGIDSIYDNGSISQEAKDAMKAVRDVDFKRVVRSLMMDMPYEMYWFDKVAGYSMGSTYSLSGKTKNGIETIRFTGGSPGYPAWKFSLNVAKAYRSNISANYAFDTALAAGAEKAAAKAAQDVLDVMNSVSSDYAKLNTYKKLIQGYSEYNHPAVDDSSTSYGDPWQMIYVFDEDPSTKVVCEGFSKAFKFMCDLSCFAGDINCYLVSGFLNGTGGSHMWNNVRMEDGNIYIVDVTNSRSESAVNFLGGAVFSESQTIRPYAKADKVYYDTHAYICGSNKYYYDYLTLNLYDDDVLKYTSTAYNASAAKTTCRVTLSMNHAGGGKQTVCVYKGEDTLDKINGIIPAREGYAFDGWYTLSEGGNALKDMDELIVNDDSSVFYARWRSLEKFSVTAYAGEGRFADDSISQNAMLYEGKTYYDSFGIPEGQKHYQFSGWYEEDGTLIPENATFDPSRSRNIYARYELKKYALTLNPNGGEFEGGSQASKVLRYKALTILPDPDKYTPSRAGYDFEGWFTKKTDGTEYDISQPIEQDVTLYAYWKEKEPITPSENETEPEDNDSISINGFYATFADDGMYKDGNGIWHAVYTGDKLTPSVRVYDNRLLLTEGVDYSLKYVNNTKAFELSGETACVQIKGKGNIKGNYKLHFAIDRRSLQDVSIGSLCVKEGSEDKADPALTYNGRLLKKDKDYSFDVAGNTVNIQGIGNFTGSISAALKVQNAAEYADRSIKVKLDLPEIIYDGKEKFLKDGSELIVRDKMGRGAAYSVSYSPNINAGVVRIVICGTGEYHGVIRKSFRIKPCRVKGEDAFEVKYDKSVRYQKGGAKARVISIKCKLTGEVLKEGTEIKYTYAAYKKAGTAKIKLGFKGNYKGSSYPVLKYTVEKRDLADAQVYIGDMAYTTPKKYNPKVVVTCDGSIVSPKEYTVEYTERSKISEPKEDLPISVTAVEKNYCGHVESISYNICSTGMDINNAKIVFSKGARTQNYEGHGEAVTLTAGDDFTVKINKDMVLERGGEIEKEFDIIYTDNTSKGTATLILVPKTDKFVGITKTTFKIKAADINSLVE